MTTRMGAEFAESIISSYLSIIIALFDDSSGAVRDASIHLLKTLHSFCPSVQQKITSNQVKLRQSKIDEITQLFSQRDVAPSRTSKPVSSDDQRKQPPRAESSITSEQQLRQQLLRLCSKLTAEDKNDWKAKADCLKTLRTLLLDHSNMCTNICRLLRPFETPISNLLGDIRSAVVDEVTTLLCQLSEEFKEKLSSFFERIMPSLLKTLYSSNQIIAEYGDSCVQTTLLNSMPPCLPLLIDNATHGKHSQTRVKCCFYVSIFIEKAPSSHLDKQEDAIENMIKKLTSDSDPNVRSTARECYHSMTQRWPLRASKIRDSTGHPPLIKKEDERPLSPPNSSKQPTLPTPLRVPIKSHKQHHPLSNQHAEKPKIQHPKTPNIVSFLTPSRQKPRLAKLESVDCIPPAPLPPSTGPNRLFSNSFAKPPLRVPSPSPSSLALPSYHPFTPLQTYRTTEDPLTSLSNTLKSLNSPHPDERFSALSKLDALLKNTPLISQKNASLVHSLVCTLCTCLKDQPLPITLGTLHCIKNILSHNSPTLENTISEKTLPLLAAYSYSSSDKPQNIRSLSLSILTLLLDRTQQSNLDSIIHSPLLKALETTPHDDQLKLCYVKALGLLLSLCIKRYDPTTLTTSLLQSFLTKLFKLVHWDSSPDMTQAVISLIHPLYQLHPVLLRRMAHNIHATPPLIELLKFLETNHLTTPSHSTTEPSLPCTHPNYPEQSPSLHSDTQDKLPLHLLEKKVTHDPPVNPKRIPPSSGPSQIPNAKPDDPPPTLSHTATSTSPPDHSVSPPPHSKHTSDAPPLNHKPSDPSFLPPIRDTLIKLSNFGQAAADQHLNLLQKLNDQLVLLSDQQLLYTLDHENLIDSLQKFTDPQHNSSILRHRAILLFVSIKKRFGQQAFAPYLKKLPLPHQKLISIYYQRQLSQEKKTACNQNTHSAPPSSP
ncbi:uncharacterized protein LOC126316698 [Schistocerca gregaria]|uniref:uncharacterized protein LOC126316698 n=1 Tax=Schistocerca gregaria TaxID=7010 RepID=UPI00211F01C6|nr:uncharacterized protein LOC126316698 [Schistocerca gregaria]